ncbi:MAG: hypothetical protein JSU87_11480 [Gemmatimonadota bacterium]|nr:MAG: hypothetical protein JSU87_11480 [Gemmatimonadota bacterium]
MAVRWISGPDGDAPKAKPGDRRSGEDRRSGKDRRGSRGRRHHRRGIRDLYKTDLDRHLWSWVQPGARKKRRQEAGQTRRRHTLAGLLASAAGTVGAAGLSYYLWKRLRTTEKSSDPEHEQADLDEADFE